MRRNAFTLIELLVVIAIIAVLMAILMPFGIWHRDNASTLSFADGHVDMHKWRSRGLIEWNLKALHEPQNFAFYRSPQDDEEREDFEFALDAYACKALQ